MSDEIAIAPEAQAEAREAEMMLTQYGNYAVSTAADYRSAGEALLRVKTQTAKLDEMRKSMTRPIDESKRRIMDFFLAPLNALKETKERIEEAMRSFTVEQKRIAAEAEAAALALQRKEEDRLNRLAEAANQRGDGAKAEAFLAKAETLANTPVVVTPVAPPSVAGMSKRIDWKFEVVDPALVPREYCSVDEVRIGGVVRATKGQVPIPGVRIYSEETFVSTGRVSATSETRRLIKGMGERE
jgi:hypothetical protein